MKTVICVSGGGTNLQAILDASASGALPGVEIIRVISNNAGAFALERAKTAGVEAEVISPRDYTDRQAFEAAFCARMRKLSPDLIVLAGFLVTIPAEMIRDFPRRIINIHPSLIPSFCGTGYYGLRVHEAALSRGVKVSGATVHIVDEGMDTGPILLQKAVEVREGDTPEVLQRRVMEEAEWILLPEAIRLFSEGRFA